MSDFWLLDCCRVQIGRKSGQDILRQDTVARRVEAAASGWNDPVSRVSSLPLCLHGAREDAQHRWNHESRTGETGAKPGHKRPGIAPGDTGQRIDAEMAKGLRILAQSDERLGAGVG